jgi:hypothetical protein
MRSIDASYFSAGTPPRTTQASVLVPPMSIAMTSGRCRTSVSRAAPIRPPAGPEKMVWTPTSAASRATSAPPPERVM